MFTKSQTIWLAAAMLMGLLLRPGGALPKPDKIEIKDFFGLWAGVSVTENGLGSNVPIATRDLDVAILRQAGGFRVCWTTVRAGGPGDLIRTEWRFVFEPGAARDTWQAVETGNAQTTRSGVWANLRGRTLTIFGIITSDEGFSGLQIYDRTLDEFGMRLDFLRADRDHVLRGLSGELKRAEEPSSPAATEHDPREADLRELVETAAAAPAEIFCGDA